ncbi:MAG: sodium-dependent transporter [bacterium]|nr:sodium-dependent transporter [bacterium]
MQKVAKRESWSSHNIFILACIGSAVGLGNIWRFSYITGLHGGGSFVLLYILAVLLIGLPALLVELTVGKKLRTSAVKSFKEMLGKRWWLVAFPLGLCLLVLSYYLVVMGWTLFYTFTSLGGEYIPFESAVGDWALPLGGVISLILVWIVARTDIKSGLEKINVYLFPIFFASLILIFINSFTLPGINDAIAYLTTIDMDALLSPINILNAITQAIFSISVGEAVMLTYGSYLKKKEEIFHSSLAIAAADSMIAIIGAIVVFTVTFTFAIPTTSGAELAFESLPLAFLSMPFGSIIMFLFFLLLFSAATTSAVSLSEVLIDNLRIKLSSRAKAGWAMLALLLIFFIPSALSYSPLAADFALDGVPFLEFMDAHIIGRFAPLIVVASLVAFTWGWKGCKKALAENVPAPFVTPVYIMVKYIVPVAILALQVAELLS